MIRKPPPPTASSASNLGRLAHLVNTGLLDSPVEEAFERLTNLAARTIGAPICLVSLVDQDRQFFKSAFGLPEPWLTLRETPLTHSFCKHVVETGSPLIIENSRCDPLVKNNAAIVDLNVIAYAGIPLILKNGQCIGSFCVIDHTPRQWTSKQIRLLADIAASVMGEVELRMLMAAKEELLDIIFHDLRNPLSAILLNARMTQLKSNETGDSDLSRIADTSYRAAERIKNILEDVLELSLLDRGTFKFNFAEFAPADLLHKALETVKIFADQNDVGINCSIEQSEPTSSIQSAPLIKCDGPKFTQALVNLLLNSIRRCSRDRTITVNLRQEADLLRVDITDSGRPILPEEAASFFDRYKQTATLSSKSDKLAICLAHQLILGHEGTVAVETSDSNGNTFRVSIPLKCESLKFH